MYAQYIEYTFWWSICNCTEVEKKYTSTYSISYNNDTPIEYIIIIKGSFVVFSKYRILVTQVVGIFIDLELETTRSQDAT